MILENGAGGYGPLAPSHFSHLSRDMGNAEQARKSADRGFRGGQRKGNMDTITLNFKVTVSDFREASYYGLFMRRRSAFRAAAVVLLASFVYGVLCWHRVLPLEPLLLFPAGACLIWFLFVLAGAERQILSCVRSPDTLIGAAYTASLDHSRFSFSLPDRNFCVSGPVSELYCAFELSRCFLIYATQEQLFIVPIRQMSQDEIKTLRKILQAGLNSRFATPFGKKEH